MTGMVEKVARALAGGDWDSCPYDRPMWMRDARDAIEAMREPTDLMGLGLPSDYRPGTHSATQIWSAMIDAALKE